MGTGLNKFHNLMVFIIIFAFSLAACQAFNPLKNDQLPTQDVGEQPPTMVSTPTLVPSIPFSTATPTDPVDSGNLLIGPALYPTPDTIIVPWEQLINPGLIADLKWETYRGELLGNEAGNIWSYSFLYPIVWYGDTKPSLTQTFVQSIPVTQDPAQSEFVKFEIVHLTSPPMIDEGHVINPSNLITVEVAGESGILFNVTQLPGQMRQITVVLQHNGAWLVATGYINLPAADTADLDKFSAIIYTILSSFRFTDQVNASTLPTPTPSPVVVKKLADSEFPAAGICDASPDNHVLIKIAIGSIPEPRCIKVTADQRVEFQNETGLVVRIQLGRFDVTFPAGDIITLDAPCGEYLEPGVHQVTLSQGSVPEIWLITK